MFWCSVGRLGVSGKEHFLEFSYSVDEIIRIFVTLVACYLILSGGRLNGRKELIILILRDIRLL